MVNPPNKLKWIRPAAGALRYSTHSEYVTDAPISVKNIKAKPMIR